jgi:glycosyltransferase involved in cell wall biosynthesis
MAAAPWGGSEELWSRAAMAAIAQGHDVFASVYNRPALAAPLEKLRTQGAILHLRPLYQSKLLVRLTRRIQTQIGLIKPLALALDDFRPDIICVSQGGNFDLAQMGWLRNDLLRRATPFFIICHNYDPGHLPPTEERQAAKAGFEKARRVFFVSGEQAHVSQRQLAQTFANVELVKNPVNLTRFELLPWPSSSVPQLAIVAGLDIDRKGHDIALEVLGQAKWGCRRWHLNIYGEGVDRAYIEELVVFYGLQEYVTMHGNVSDVEEVWRRNHLLVVPSRREAAPLVVMEAMLCGRPVVATAVGTVPEWLTPAKTGFIAAAPTVPLFDDALEQAWQAQDTWPRMGQQAYEWAYANADQAADVTFLRRMLELTMAGSHTTAS